MEKRNEIVKSVTPLFLKSGFRGLTVDEIANELGVSKKTLYKYFPSKEDLIESVKEYLVQFSNIVNAQVEPFTENCVDHTYSMVEFVEKEFGFHQLRVNLQEAKHYYSEISDDLVNAYFDVATNICNRIIQRGKMEELIDENIDNNLNSLIFGQVYIFLSTAKHFRSKKDFDHAFRQWVYMISKTFLNEKGIKILKARFNS